MTTYVDFAPSQTSQFQFQAELDGTIYNVLCPWNLFGQRYYVSCFSTDGTRIFTLPLIGSPDGLTITAIDYDPATNFVTATVETPHGFTIGAITDVTVTGCLPDAYNGNVQATAINATQIIYTLTPIPLPATTLGTLFYNINLAGGFFDTLLVFRQGNQQFEIS